MPHVNPLALLDDSKRKSFDSPRQHAKVARAGDPGFAQDDIRQFGECFLLNDRVNQLLLEHLDPKAWRAKPPGVDRGGGVRTIAAIFTHMHNVRRKWLRLSAPHLELLAELDQTRCTQKQAAAALKESTQLCAEMLSDSRVTQFVRDGWARPWRLAVQANALAHPIARTSRAMGAPVRAKTKTPGAAAMLAYMVSHEAHHRGQVCMLAHQMGYRLPMKVMSEMWNWEGLAVQANALHHPITRTSCVIGTPVRAKSKARAQGARHRKS
jgi:uncharacterized damage-inducible protein DinB